MDDYVFGAHSLSSPEPPPRVKVACRLPSLPSLGEALRTGGRALRHPGVSSAAQLRVGSASSAPCLSPGQEVTEAHGERCMGVDPGHPGAVPGTHRATAAQPGAVGLDMFSSVKS